MSDNLNTIGIRGKIAARTPDYRYTLPEGGNPGDIPVKTETGVEWQQPEPATTTPDYLQNDEAASDYIKNRPGGYTVTRIIEWDGSTEGLERVGDVYKVSGETFEQSDVKSIETTNGKIDMSVVRIENYGPFTIYSFPKDFAIYMIPEDATIEGIFLTKGTYFNLNNDESHVTQLHLEHNVKIKKEYISKPDDAVGSYYFPSSIVEKSVMLAAIDDFRKGKAIIVWNGVFICGASYSNDESGTSTIYIEYPSGDVFKYKEQNASGMTIYNETLRLSTDNNLIPTNRIENGAITADKIADEAVTENKLADGVLPSASKLLPTVTASDSGKFLRVSSTGAWEAEEGIILNSSTAGSTKKFKITVDDSGTLSATEVTQ